MGDKINAVKSQSNLDNIPSKPPQNFKLNMLNTVSHRVHKCIKNTIRPTTSYSNEDNNRKAISIS